MPDNNEIFLEFWQNYQWPIESILRFRLYYDEQGAPISYTHEDQAGTYITVTPEQFALADMRVRVRDAQLIPVPRPSPPKLIPGDRGIPCHPSDVCVIQDLDQPVTFWRLRTNETH